jgi:hypothetical protein
LVSARQDDVATATGHRGPVVLDHRIRRAERREEIFRREVVVPQVDELLLVALAKDLCAADGNGGPGERR